MIAKLRIENAVYISDQITIYFIIIIIYQFQANCTLRVLDLSWNGFSDLGAVALADALKANNTLTELDLWLVNL